MKRSAAFVAACTAVLCCTREREPATSPITTNPRQTYTLSGTVRDSSGVPVLGATAVLSTVITNARSGPGTVALATTTTNEAGFFKFAGAVGAVAVRISKDDFNPYFKILDLTSDLGLDVTIAKALLSDTIQLGRTIRSTVSATAAPCDPYGWDAMAPCRRFSVTPSSNGAFSIVITWSGQPELDATLVTPTGAYIGNSFEAGFERITMNSVVTAGRTYELRVNSYYGAQSFYLTATLTPP